MHGTFHANPTLARETRVNIGTVRAIAGETPKAALLARCLLKEARGTFADRGWKHLPQTERGRAILIWGADQAWLASPDNPKRSVSRWCKRWAPWLTDAELRAAVSDTETSNKRWSRDQSATVLEISLAERTKRNLRYFGANDDPHYEARNGIKKAKAAERQRRHRAKHSTGAKPGRPALELSPDKALEHRRKQDAERARRYRASRKTPSRHSRGRGIDSVTGFSVTHEERSPLGLAIASATARLPIRSSGSDLAEEGPRTPSHCQAPSFDQPEALEFARRRLQTVANAMMRSEEPASWQPQLMAATSAWAGNRLMDDDDGETNVIPFDHTDGLHRWRR